MVSDPDADEQRVKAVCINTLPMGFTLQSNIGKDRLQKADDIVEHLSVRHEYISDTPGANYLDIFFNNILCLRTPANYGRIYKIPSAYFDPRNRHRRPLNSIFKQLVPDYDPRKKEYQISAKKLLTKVLEFRRTE